MTKANPKHPLPLWLLKTPLVIVMSVIVGFFIYWFVSAAFEQWDRNVHSGAVALMFIEERSGKKLHEFQCKVGDEGWIELIKDAEVFEYGAFIKALQSGEAEDSEEFYSTFKDVKLSHLSVPTKNCRRWAEIIELHKDLQKI